MKFCLIDSQRLFLNKLRFQHVCILRSACVTVPSVCTRYKTRRCINWFWSNLIATNFTKNCRGISVFNYIELSYRPVYMRFCTHFERTSKNIDGGGKKFRGDREEWRAFFSTFSVSLQTQYTELQNVDTDLRQVGIAANAVTPPATRNCLEVIFVR